MTTGIRIAWQCGAAMLCSTIGLANAYAANLSAPTLNALRAESPYSTLSAAVRSGDWPVIEAALQTVDPTAGPRDAKHELSAEQLARALEEAPMTAASRRWLQQVASWTVLTTEQLPDAGRDVSVPAFPAGAAARASLRVWQARADAARLRTALMVGAGADQVALTPQLLARLDAAELRGLAGQLPRQLPPEWALRQLQVAPGQAALADWISAEMEAREVASASRRLAGCQFVLALGDLSLFDQLALAVQRTPTLRSAWLDALASVSTPRSLTELQRWTEDRDHGLDAIRGLARRGDGQQWLRRQLAAPERSATSLRRILIALAEQGDAATLRGWAAGTSRHPELAQEVLAWLGD